MTTSVAKLLLDTIELRAGSVITANEIRALKMRWRPMTANRLKINPYDEAELMMGFAPFQVEEEAMRAGRKWWANKLWRKDATLRDTKLLREMTDGMRNTVVAVVWHMERIELVDWYWRDNGYGLDWPFPLYRAYGALGRWFEYVNEPWQSGGEGNRVTDWGIL